MYVKNKNFTVVDADARAAGACWGGIESFKRKIGQGLHINTCDSATLREHMAESSFISETLKRAAMRILNLN